jgi:hypothetical protein
MASLAEEKTIKSEPKRYSYKSPSTEKYTIHKDGRWVDKERVVYVPTYPIHGIDMFDCDLHDDRPWEIIVEEATRNKKDTVRCVLHTSACGGRVVKQYSSVRIADMKVVIT